jgi:hypothetical protein
VTFEVRIGFRLIRSNATAQLKEKGIVIDWAMRHTHTHSRAAHDRSAFDLVINLRLFNTVDCYVLHFGYTSGSARIESICSLNRS